MPSACIVHYLHGGMTLWTPLACSKACAARRCALPWLRVESVTEQATVGDRHHPCQLMQVGTDGRLSCTCSQCSAWKQYLKGALAGGPSWRQYEVWTHCYISALAAYLRHAPAILALACLS
jgi:hypothetical protein